MLTASLLITGCLVLPDLALQPGMIPFSGLFVAAWALNLVSGLAIAQVAIHQQQQQRTDTPSSPMPSSFKEFAQEQLPADSTFPTLAH